MAQGKYSPTVSEAYRRDQEWWDKFASTQESYAAYDPEGYDRYGYDKDDNDRSDRNEHDYLNMDSDDFQDIQTDWTFDGVKPVLTQHAVAYYARVEEIEIGSAIALLASKGYTVTKG